MSRGWAGGSTRRWRRIRAAVLEANRVNTGGQCQVQVPGVCTVIADCVHHPLGKRAGDRHDNTVPSCTACNLHIGAPVRNSPEPVPRTEWGP